MESAANARESAFGLGFSTLMGRCEHEIGWRTAKGYLNAMIRLNEDLPTITADKVIEKLKSLGYGVKRKVQNSEHHSDVYLNIKW